MKTPHCNNEKERVIGIDLHPSCFAGAALTNEKPSKARELWVHKKVEMTNLEKWLKNNVKANDIMVLEAGNSSFEFVKTAKALGLNAIVLDSVKVGQLSKSYCKNDSIDAVKLARIYLTGLPENVWIPDDKTRVRRQIVAEYDNATKDATRCKNRIRSWLTEHHLRLPKGTRLTKESGRSTVLKLYEWTDSQKTMVHIMFDDLYHCEKKRLELKKLITKEVMNDVQCVKLMQLCGVRALTAFALIARIGDINRFASPKKLAAYIGMIPVVKASGANSWRGGISRRGCGTLKAKLIQAAQSVFRAGDENGGELKQWAIRLWMRKGNKKVAIATVARKLIVSAWYCLKGYFTELEAVTPALKAKAAKMVQDLGREAVLSLGYDKTTDFKQEFLQKMLLTT